jgi:sugar-specific transcriptional regulator TrmB
MCVEERLVGILSLFGLNEREARVFVFLTKNGSCGAGELAKALDIRRMEAYRLLKRLLDRGIVVSTAGKPIKYQAETIDGIISLLTDEQRRVVKKMDDARPELLELWKQVPRAPKESFEQRFRIIQGREQIYSSMSKMVEGATASLTFLLTKNDVVQAYLLGIGDKVAEAYKRGVRTKVATVVDSSTLEAIEGITEYADVRHAEESARTRLLIADGLQTLVSLVLDDTKGVKNERDVAIWTDSRDYAEMMGGLYQTSFANAEDAAERLAVVRNQLRFEERVSKTLQVVRTALAERGWEMEVPGKIIGVSGSSYEFSASLTGPGGKVHGLDVVFGTKDSPVAEKVTSSATKKLDIKDTGLIIIASPAADDATASLANLLGVTLVDGTDAVDAAAAVRNSVEEGA